MLARVLVIAATLGLAIANSQADNRCGKDRPACSEDKKCVPEDNNCTDLKKCAGYCHFKNQYKDCGGLRPEPVSCPENSECVDDPRVRGSCGMACDGPGICAPKEKKPCGGFIGLECPEGLYCYYPESGPCDPENGGRDCLGFCL